MTDVQHLNINSKYSFYPLSVNSWVFLKIMDI